MKGISLPINAIIIVIIGVTVLIALLVAFTTNVFSGTETAALRSAMEQGCAKVRWEYHCNIDSNVASLTYNVNGKEMKLSTICQKVGGSDDIAQCCGCHNTNNYDYSGEGTGSESETADSGTEAADSEAVGE